MTPTDHPTYRALLAAILAAPADDAPRLMYADWLDENGDGARAEFIRVQCERARLLAIVERWTTTPSRKPGGTREDGGAAGIALAEAQLLEDRERELLSAHREKWFPLWEELWHGLEASWNGLSDPAEFRRGFAATITCPADDWFRHADALTAASPIEEVTLTTLWDASAMEDVRRWRQAPRLGGRVSQLIRGEWPQIRFHFPLLNVVR